MGQLAAKLNFMSCANWKYLTTSGNIFELIPIKQIFRKLTVAVSRIYVMGLYFVRLKIMEIYGTLSFPVFFFPNGNMISTIINFKKHHRLEN